MSRVVWDHYTELSHWKKPKSFAKSWTHVVTKEAAKKITLLLETEIKASILVHQLRAENLGLRLT